MEISIKRISFEIICPIWTNYLWPERSSTIENYSQIVFNKHPYQYNSEYKFSEFIGLGAFVDDALVGVNSCHQTGISLRSRGLYVFPKFRRLGLGNRLLEESIKIGFNRGLMFTWSMPREDSISAYERSGFNQCSEWFKTETSGKNCFVVHFND